MSWPAVTVTVSAENPVMLPPCISMSWPASIVILAAEMPTRPLLFVVIVPTASIKTVVAVPPPIVKPPVTIVMSPPDRMLRLPLSWKLVKAPDCSVTAVPPSIESASAILVPLKYPSVTVKVSPDSRVRLSSVKPVKPPWLSKRSSPAMKLTSVTFGIELIAALIVKSPTALIDSVVPEKASKADVAMLRSPAAANVIALRVLFWKAFASIVVIDDGNSTDISEALSKAPPAIVVTGTPPIVAGIVTSSRQSGSGVAL